MNFSSTVRFIVNHPINRGNKAKAFFRFLKWQINVRLNPYPIIYQFTDKCKLIIQKGMTGATGNLYCGVHEFTDMLFLLHFLRKDDLFIDIGANIGSYTILASAHVKANTISIEPVPSTFAHLLNNVLINNIQTNVNPLNIAVGSKKDTIIFTSAYDTVNHVAVHEEQDTVTVPIDTLDNLLSDDKMPSLLKIDVEGYETEVIKGSKNALSHPQLKAIIIELNGSGGRYGYNESDIHQTLLTNGFEPYSYDPFDRKLTRLTTFGSHNTIYVRDLDFVMSRLQTAPKVQVLTKLL